MGRTTAQGRTGEADGAEEIHATAAEIAAATTRIDVILAGLPADQRTALQSLRKTIAANAPDAVDTISYGVPAFRYHGRPLVAYAAAKGHCSLFPMSGAVMEAYRVELAVFDTSKGTIRFRPDRPLPNALIAAIVRARMQEIDG